MRKVLCILGSLDDEDLDWFLAVGQVRSIETGQRLVGKGDQLDCMYLVLQGGLAESDGGVAVSGGSEIGPGETLGETAVLDSRPQQANVTATEPSRVLRIPHTRLSDRLANDSAFSARFNEALALLQTDDSSGDDELQLESLGDLSLAARRFEWILRVLKSEADDAGP